MKITLKNEKSNWLIRLEILRLKLEVFKTLRFNKLYNYEGDFCGVDFLNLRFYK